ncbi:SDR family oxidoreductase [Actinokineospora inagensis]|uniref:SDR family oxidoreductase n=1 Tax=Actinokineospora inagensis TaxID=103730 RepID=UPI0003F514C9|nr:SDR family oxidoreductase [Actinokineospora inagensis]
MPTAIVTGAARELVRALAAAGWSVVTTARDPATGKPLPDSAINTPGARETVVVPGDITEPAHRDRLIAAADARGGAALVVHDIGAPDPPGVLACLPVPALRVAFERAVTAPFALTQLALPALRHHRGAVVTITSGSASGICLAAVEQLGKVLSREEPAVRVWLARVGGGVSPRSSRCWHRTG